MKAIFLCATWFGCTAASAPGIGRDAEVADDGDGSASKQCEALADRPGVRSEHTAVLDETGEQVVVYGGSTAVPVDCDIPEAAFVDEVWLFDEPCRTWRNATPKSEGPGARGRHMAAWDAASRRMFIFGGRSTGSGTSSSYTLRNDLWAWDAAAESWQSVHDGAEVAPTPRFSGALGYDAPGDALWLFGGDAAASGASSDPLDDTWRFDFASAEWTEVDAGAGPAARLQPAYAVDTLGERLLVFGGADERRFQLDATYFADLWALSFSGSRWDELDSGRGPEGRFFSSAVFAVDQFVVFAGHDGGALGNRNDLWKFDDLGGYRLVAAGDTVKNSSAGFCDFPADFAAVDLAQPERRNAFGFASGAGRAWMFGGKTDCGAVDDMWKLDLETLAWKEVVTARSGEVCLRRTDGDALSQCSGLCL